MDTSQLKYSIAASVDPDMAAYAFLNSRYDKIYYQKQREPRLEKRFIASSELKKINWEITRLVKHPTKLTLLQKKYGKTDEHMIKIFDTYDKPKAHKYRAADADQRFVKHYMDKLHTQTKQARLYEHKYRLEAEMKIATHFGHYIVFNSLTIDGPESMDIVFQKNSKAWASYITRWNRNHINHRYFAVVEQGGKNGRLHIHVIHMFERHTGLFPCDDPNYGKNNPYYREISYYKQYWRYGFSAPIAVRTQGFDAWAKRNWRWPTKAKDDPQPIAAKPPQALARYMTKYMLKAYSETNKDRQIWKIRQTHGLGLHPIKMILNLMSLKQICQTFLNPISLRFFQKPDDRTIPRQLIIREAHRTAMSLMTQQNYQSKLNLIQTLKPQQSIKRRLQTMIRSKGKILSLSSITSSTTLNLTNTDIFKITEIFQEVELHYYPTISIIHPSGVTVRRT